MSEAILILLYCRYGQDHLVVPLVWCSLKYVTTTLGYCLAGYIYCTAQGNLVSFPMPCVYDTMIYAVLLLISLLLYTLINATCAGTRLYR